jgi:hypothetical protein
MVVLTKTGTLISFPIMDAMGTKRKARTIAGLLMAEVEVVAGGVDVGEGEGKMVDLEIIKEYLAVSFKQEGEHRTHKMSENVRKLINVFGITDASMAINATSAMTLMLTDFLSTFGEMFFVCALQYDWMLVDRIVWNRPRNSSRNRATNTYNSALLIHTDCQLHGL